MNHFHDLDPAEKEQFQQKLLECVNAYGGKNPFLLLLEDLRQTNPHPLIHKHCIFRSDTGYVKWTKIIFNDKLQLLMKVRLANNEERNLLPSQEEKSYKKIMNMVRTLGPIEFTVKPKNKQNGEGFTIRPVDIMSDHLTRINPLFETVFFTPLPGVKKILNYKRRES